MTYEYAKNINVSLPLNMYCNIYSYTIIYIASQCTKAIALYKDYANLNLHPCIFNFWSDHTLRGC